MTSTRLPLPDPLLTANVYCAGRLDAVLHRGVAPFWRRFREDHAEEQAYLWCVRYPRGGEHLKLRLHAAEALEPELRSALEVSVTEALRELGSAPIAPAPPRPGRAAHRRRGRLRSSARRSELPLDALPEERCLLRRRAAPRRRSLCGALDALPRCGLREGARRPPAGHTGNVAFRARQIPLLKAGISAMASLRWSPERRSAYLAYHRNWLLRFVLVQGGHGPSRRQTGCLDSTATWPSSGRRRRRCKRRPTPSGAATRTTARTEAPRAPGVPRCAISAATSGASRTGRIA